MKRNPLLLPLLALVSVARLCAREAEKADESPRALSAADALPCYRWHAGESPLILATPK